MPLVLLTLAVLLSIERNGNTQSKPSPEKRETPAALPAHGANQNNQSALYAALIGALHAVTEQEKAAAKQSRAQNETLIAPPAVQEGLLVVGFLYSFLAWLQWKEISKQAKIANQSLALQFRPKLIIRNVVVDPPYPKQVQDAATAVFRAGYPVVGQLYVANVGSTRAEITESGCWVKWMEGWLPMKRPYEGLTGNAAPFIKSLQPGTSTPMKFESEEIFPAEPIGAMIVRNNFWQMFVLGWVEYRDDAAITRRTAFCRQWQFDAGRFVIVDEPDYEYAE